MTSRVVACFLALTIVACGSGEQANSKREVAASPVADAPEVPQNLPGDKPPGQVVLDKGIDVSSHSGEIDWKAIEEGGFSFVFLKATEGMDLQDPAFGDHWEAAKTAGIPRGAYHFYVTEDDPQKQANFFIQNVELQPGDLAPVVDIESIGHGTEPGLADRLKTWLSLVESHYGIKPIIYTSPNFWNEHLTADFGHYPLWIAEYGVDSPRIPKGWTTWHLWQMEGDATVQGVEKGADLNRANRDGPDLSVLLVPPTE